MAQSAVVCWNTPILIDAFWEKTTITPPLSWDKWTQQRKSALIAKEGIRLETLLNEQSTTVTCPPETLYEEPVEKHIQSNKRDRKVCNQHLNLMWKNRCEKK